MKADARVRENRGRLAVERGPVVYCAEWPDVDGGHALTAMVAANAELKPSADTSFGDDVTVLDAAARQVINATAAPTKTRLIPYHLWANRGAAVASVTFATRGWSTTASTGPPPRTTPTWRGTSTSPTTVGDTATTRISLAA